MESQPSSVLVVDDEELNRKLFQTVLAHTGFELRFASDGASALAAIFANPPDLVLLDYSMPDMTGIDVLHELSLSGQLEGLPVVMVTASADAELRRAALRAGAIDFLPKPFDQIELLCKVQALTELRRLRRIAETRAAQTARDESRAAVEQAIAGLPLVLYSSDEEEMASGQWSVASMAMYESGETPARPLVAGLEWTILAHPDDREGLKQDLRRLQRGEIDSLTGRLRLKGADGSWVWYQNVARRTPSGEAICGALLDIGEQIRLEGQLMQAQKIDAIGELAGGIAHDFNNVLGAILSFGSLLRDSLPPPDPRRADAEEIVAVTRRATGLTRQLLSFARSDSAEPRAVDLNRALRAQKRMLQGLLPDEVVLDLRLHRGGELPTVLMDPVQLDQIVMNLVLNASDAIVGGGWIEVGVDLQDDEVVVLSVRDDGAGMEPEILDRVFEPFFSTKVAGRGTGLGLSTVFGIVRNSGGSVSVNSEVGVGTEFQITLPRCLDAMDETAESISTPTIADAQRVLVVEDNPALAASVVRLLEGAGYHVDTAASGPAAIEAIDALGDDLDAVYSDVRLPGLDGFAVVAHAGRSRPGVVTLLTSGYLDGKGAAQPADQPPILWKPVEPRHLLTTLASLLSDAAGSRPPSGPIASLAPDDSGATDRCETLAVRGLDGELPATLDEADLARVVVVDDDAAIQRALGRLLRARGYEVVACGTLAGARELLLVSGIGFRAALCDLGLPDGCAAGLVRDLWRERPELAHRVLVLSGGAMTDDARSLLHNPSVARMDKPVDPGELLGAIEALA